MTLGVGTAADHFLLCGEQPYHWRSLKTGFMLAVVICGLLLMRHALMICFDCCAFAALHRIRFHN